MKTEINAFLTLALVLSSFGCGSTAAQEKLLRTYSASVLACADGYFNGRPDGHCNTEGDRPLQINVSLKDIHEKIITSAQTDVNGKAKLQAEVQKGNALYLGYPKSVLLDDGKGNGQFIESDEPIISGPEDNLIIELPITPQVQPNPNSGST